jgi:hypothetical protein
MYRLKARKGDGDWVPIITKPEIVQEYSQNTVDTLHQKNLLLLGEDRFLTTLMLRNFPYRKMVFTPQAVSQAQNALPAVWNLTFFLSIRSVRLLYPMNSKSFCLNGGDGSTRQYTTSLNWCLSGIYVVHSASLCNSW